MAAEHLVRRQICEVNEAKGFDAEKLGEGACGLLNDLLSHG